MMKRRLGILTTAAIAMGGTSAAPVVKFDSPSQQTRFAIELHDSLIFVPVTINGSRKLWFVLDTGASRNLIDRKVARSLGLHTDGVDSTQGAGAGRIPIEPMHGITIRLPGLTSEGHEAAAIDLGSVGESIGRAEDGLLGYDFLQRFVVKVDYANRQMTVSAPEAARPGSSAVALPIEFRGKWPFVKAELTIPGDVTVQDNFLVDSGSSDAVDHPIIAKMQDKRPTATGVGLGEAVQGYIARAKSFQIGGFVFKTPLVACCGATDDTSRLVGGDILHHFTVTFDYPRKQMRLEPNRNFSEPLH